MADIAVTEGLFFTKTGMDKRGVDRIVGDALKGCDDGELYLEYCQSESFSFDDGRIKNASFDTSQGFGLRAVSGETTGFAHATTFSEDAIARAAETVKAVRSGAGGTLAAPPSGTCFWARMSAPNFVTWSITSWKSSALTSANFAASWCCFRKAST